VSTATRLAAFAMAVAASLAAGALLGTIAGPIDVGGDEHDDPAPVTVEHDDHGGWG
jgi:hypothetical protein